MESSRSTGMKWTRGGFFLPRQETRDMDKNEEDHREEGGGNLFTLYFPNYHSPDGYILSFRPMFLPQPTPPLSEFLFDRAKVVASMRAIVASNCSLNCNLSWHRFERESEGLQHGHWRNDIVQFSKKDTKASFFSKLQFETTMEEDFPSYSNSDR